MTQTHEAAFETVIESHLLANGYVAENCVGFDRERAIFPNTVLGFTLVVVIGKRGDACQ
jgi:type I restriction enzyme R subunit